MQHCNPASQQQQTRQEIQQKPAGATINQTRDGSLLSFGLLMSEWAGLMAVRHGILQYVQCAGAGQPITCIDHSKTCVQNKFELLPGEQFARLMCSGI